MCTGAEALMMTGQVAGGLARSAYGDAQASLARADAMYEMDAASQQAQQILRAARRQKGAARAATGASGARIDEFSMGAEQEIEQLAQEDAAMTILSGKRKARGLEFSGAAAKRAGKAELAGSLFSAASTGYSGWKGAKTGTQDTGFQNAGWWQGGEGWEGE